MTKKEIEDKVIEYAGKAEYNSKTTENEVKDRINSAVKQIVALAFLLPNQGKDFRFGQNQKVVLILSQMRKDIEAIIKKSVRYAKSISGRLNGQFGYKTADWDTDKWVESQRYNKTYLQRLYTYTLRMKFELEAFVAVGMVRGLSQNQITDWFMMNINSPHTVPEILDAEGYLAVRTSGILAVGVGGITSAYKSIVRLNKDMVMAGYAIANNKTWGKYGLYKYVLVVNDAKTCAACQMNIGLTFPADEFVAPLHPSCRCREVLIVP